jgi:hypothetical protein
MIFFILHKKLNIGVSILLLHLLTINLQFNNIRFLVLWKKKQMKT